MDARNHVRLEASILPGADEVIWYRVEARWPAGAEWGRVLLACGIPLLVPPAMRAMLWTAISGS
jgi:hypothetical protein